MKINLKIKLFAILILLIGCEQEITTSPPLPKPIKPAKAFISSYPDSAEIFLNGSITGSVTPDTIDGLDEGLYTLTLKKKFFKDTSFVITLKKDTIVSYFIDYTKNPAMYGNLSLNSKPEGALIIINDSVTNEFTPAYIYINCYRVIITYDSKKKDIGMLSLQHLSIAALLIIIFT